MNQVAFDQFYKKFYDTKQELELKRSRLFLASEKLKVIAKDVSSNIFLACLVGIKEFYTVFFESIGITIKSNQRIHAYSQVDFDERYGFDKTNTPDGMIVITDGITNPNVIWTGLVEFKTKGVLKKEQIKQYAEIGKDHKYKFDSVITISNDFVSDPAQNPFNLKNTSTFKFYHFSWKRIQTMLQYTIQKGISDEDQVYLATQYALYLNAHKDIQTFDKMNSDWLEQIKIIQLSGISKKDKELLEKISTDWVQEEQDLGLKLKARYGKDIFVKLSKSEQERLSERKESIKELLLQEKELTTTYLIKPSKASQSPFKISSKRNMELVNTVKLDTSRQIISVSVDNSNCPPKTLRKQLEYFIVPLLDSEPGLIDKVNLDVKLANRAGNINKTIEKISSDINRDILIGFELIEAKAVVREYEISVLFDISRSIGNRKKIITSIEENFIAFYNQYVEPFIE